jgi:2,4-dienoyl-CoA reductase-like NADH-dependent reductase (Old Yellow Enzyme family)
MWVGTTISRSSVHSSSKSPDLKKKEKVDPADNMLNIVAAFGKDIAQELASLGDEMAKYCKKNY